MPEDTKLNQSIIIFNLNEHKDMYARRKPSGPQNARAMWVYSKLLIQEAWQFITYISPSESHLHI